MNQNREFDFHDAIGRLEIKAKSCRKRFYGLSGVLVITVLMFAQLIVTNLSNFNSYQTVSLEKVSAISMKSGENSVQAPFVRQIQKIMDEKIGEAPSNSYFSRGEEVEFTPPSKEREAELNASLKEAFSNLEKTKKIFEKEKPPVSTGSDWGFFVSSSVFSLGAIGFIILFLNISLMFMRYYARLAELYDAQADALRASNGDVENAYKFLEHFSPNSIEIGRTPSTLYEKALDTIGNVAKNKP
ncbi:hypothetical protein [Vibrio diabolicus]|uniref:hypothetical protein n=1 Tax=Vibrio diabolicus TaxID=50719 RepID=UPI00216040AF|nr:hypothetical protein [Vibrio diabolicus]MCS0367465.1 hypothetical protein [Vibrio diabolicus]